MTHANQIESKSGPFEIEFAFSKTEKENWPLWRIGDANTIETSLLGIQFFPNGMIVCKDTSAALVFDRYEVQEVNRHLSLARFPDAKRAYISFTVSRPPVCLLYSLRVDRNAPFVVCCRPRPAVHGWKQNREYAVFWVLCGLFYLVWHFHAPIPVRMRSRTLLLSRVKRK